MSPEVWQHLQSMGGTSTTAHVALRWAAVTEVGRVRAVNEDSVLADPPAFVVADGMGGHEAGDVASGLAIERLRELVDSPPVNPDQVSALLGTANDEILLAGTSQDESRAMGTTAVGLVLIDAPTGPTWMLFNIGDSRIYRYLDGSFEQLSVDHSYVQELVDSGQITATEALDHPQRNVVTRALGVDTDSGADLWLRSPVPGERFLLCSDGLSGEVGYDAMSEVLSGLSSPEETTETLVDLAMMAGGTDNISVIVVDVEAVNGASSEDYITAPRDDATRETEVVGPTTVSSSALGSSQAGSPETEPPKAEPPDAAASASGPSALTPEAGSLIQVPTEIAVPSNTGEESSRMTQDLQDGSSQSAPAGLIAGVPDDLPATRPPKAPGTSFEVAEGDEDREGCDDG